MGHQAKVFNISSNRNIKRGQAIGRVEHCISEWVEFGFKIRDLTLAEIIAKRSQQAHVKATLAFAEIPGILFRPAESGAIATRAGYELVRAANQFAEMQLQ